MSDIELVVKMPEEAYKLLKNKGVDWLGAEHILNAVANGTPLPKGHGRLGDLDALQKEISSWGMNDYEPSDFTNEIDRTDTIIPADKAESENK